MRTLVIPENAMDQLGYGELLDACDAVGVDADKISGLKRNAQARFMIAVAWVITRRDEPALTWTEMQQARVEVGKAAAVNPPETVVPLRPSRSPRATPQTKSAG